MWGENHWHFMYLMNIVIHLPHADSYKCAHIHMNQHTRYLCINIVIIKSQVGIAYPPIKFHIIHGPFLTMLEMVQERILGPGQDLNSVTVAKSAQNNYPCLSSPSKTSPLIPSNSIVPPGSRSS